MLIPLLQRICTDLETLNIPYMLSGSLALNIYTVPRMTRDIDLVIALTPESIAPFLALFSEADFYYSLPAIQAAVKSHGMFNFIHHQSGYKLDFIVLKPQPFRQTEFQRKIRTDILGFPAWVVSLEDLILSKLIWIQELFSDRQAQDLQHLLSVKDLDLDYLQNWIQTLELNTFGLFDNA
jgi:hypothetical protein